MNPILKVFARPISSTNTDATFASIAAYVFALLFLVVGFTGLSRLNASEVELLLAVLAILNVSLLLVVFGHLIEIYRRLQTLTPKTPEPDQQ